MVENEKDFFYWKNPRGETERHHVSEVDRIILGKAEQSSATAREDTREPVREAGGENQTETHDPQSVRQMEKATEVSQMNLSISH